MNGDGSTKPVLVIPCSGIGKVHGLISREAAYLVIDQFAAGKADTLCLGLLIKGDDEALAAIKARPCIAIDGCPKACAEKNVRLAGGVEVKAVQVADAFRKHRGAKPGTATDLTEEGWSIAREIAKDVADEAFRAGSGKEVS